MLCTVRANEDKEVLADNESYENFHPTFTYPVCVQVHSILFANPLTLVQIYGEDENIYGYSDLVIDVSFVTLW
jgi:histone acetyltransferase 1